eukprot:4969805-Pleurochrysis_carterae.AAC.1
MQNGNVVPGLRTAVQLPRGAEAARQAARACGQHCYTQLRVRAALLHAASCARAARLDRLI